MTTRAGAVAALLLAHAVALAALCFVTQPTTDEANYLLAGAHLRAHLDWTPYNTVLHGPLAFFPNQLFAWVADPADFATYLPWGRLGFVPFSALAGLGVSVLARRAAGPRAGLAGLFLWCTNPIVLANGCLMTADMPLACGAVWTIERAWAWLAAPRIARLLGTGAALGATLATKYLALFLVPALALMLAARVVLARDAGALARVRQALAAAAVVAVTAWATLHTCYLWHGGYAPLPLPAATEVGPEDPRHGPWDEGLRAIAATAPGAALLRSLPAGWVRGIDYQRYVADRFITSFGGRRGHGFAGYYAVALGVKLPLVVLGLLALGLAVREPRWPPWSRTALLAGAGVPLAYLSFFSPLQIGVRYALAVVPLACAVAGRGLGWLWAGPRRSWRPAAAVAAALWLVGDCVLTWPGYLTAFNALAPRPYLWFRDSTLDWRVAGAPDRRRDALRARHPDAALVDERSGPRLGKVLVHGDQLGPPDPRDPGRVHHWLRRFHPRDRAGAWFVFIADAAAWDAALAADPSARARAEYAAALAGAGELQAAGELVRGSDDPTAATVRAALAALGEGRLDAIASAWLALGRPDLALALGEALPLALRAQAAYFAGDAGRVVELLDPALRRGELDTPERYLLAAALRDVGRGGEALAVLLSIEPGPAQREQHDQIVARLRQELAAMASLGR